MEDAVRVLLVEDDDADALLVQRELAAWPRHQFRVERARTLAQVSQLWRPDHDVVVLDLDLPDSSGQDTLREVLLRCHDRPVVVLSHHGGTEDALASLRNGAEDYVCKGSIEQIARSIAFALERYRLTHSARAAAVCDELTGLPNRVLFQDRLSSALRRARRNGHGVAVLYLDLDGFKPINDRHGHSIGDLVLQKVATRLSRSLRAADTVARIGGDEFAVILEEVGSDLAAAAVASKLAHELRREIYVRSRLTSERLRLDVDVSVGVALYPGHADSPNSLVRCADLAMYEAKAAADRSVVVYAGSPETASTASRPTTRDLALMSVDETLPPGWEPVPRDS